MLDLTLCDFPFIDNKFNKTKRSDFISLVDKYKKSLEVYSRVVIDLSDVIHFSAAFIALSELKKEIIILPNTQTETLKAFEPTYDYVLSSEVEAQKAQDRLIKLDLETKVTMFTSGSQGSSKKIEKKLSHLVYECDELEKTFKELSCEDLIASTVGHQHIYGVLFRILWPLIYKRTITSFNILYPEDLNRLLKKSYMESKKVVLISSPAFIKRISTNDLENVGSLKFLFSSGGKLKNSDFSSFFTNFKTDIIEVFGSTETGGIAYRSQKNGNEIWTKFDCVKLELDERECLRVRSRYIAEEFFQTNDQVSMKDSGFKLLGRVDRIIKLEEKRISLEQLEKTLCEHPMINDAHCTLLKGETRSIIGCILAEDKKWKSVSKIEKVKTLKSFLLGYFEAILLPKKFRFLEQLPYNEQSKLVKKEILEYFDE